MPGVAQEAVKVSAFTEKLTVKVKSDKPARVNEIPYLLIAERARMPEHRARVRMAGYERGVRYPG